MRAEELFREDGAVLYCMDVGELEDEGSFLTYYKTMSDERQRKVDSLLRMEDKRLSLGAGILMDKGLSEPFPFREQGSGGVCGRGDGV